MLTANYGNDRTNATLTETALTPETVGPDSFGKIGSFAVDGQVYAQPLYAAGVNVGGSSGNVLFVATVLNKVYAFDADAPCGGDPLWRADLGPPVPTSVLRLREIEPSVGILGTPVIDRVAGLIYLVAETLEGGAPVFRLHALRISDGSEAMNGPAAIRASVRGPGDGTDGVTIVFDPKQHLQRPGLLMANGAIYVGFGSIFDRFPFHGWIMAYDAGDLSRQRAIFNVTPNGGSGGFWQSGRGFAADSEGFVYAVAGNGDFDGVTNFGQAFLKLTPDLRPVDWFAPEDWRELSDFDYDLGSLGPVLLPGSDLVLGGDKAGNFYLVNRRNMGRLGLKKSAEPQIFQAVQYSGLHNTAVWRRESDAIVYLIEGGAWTGAFRIVDGKMETRAFSLTDVTSDWAFQGMALSANGGDGGILWMTAGDHFTREGVPGTLYAFDALDLTKLLYTSDMNPERDAMGGFVKFANPTVAAGRVYVPTRSGAVTVYGLLGGAGCPSVAQ